MSYIIYDYNAKAIVFATSDKDKAHTHLKNMELCTLNTVRAKNDMHLELNQLEHFDFQNAYHFYLFKQYLDKSDILNAKSMISNKSILSRYQLKYLEHDTNICCLL